MCVLQPFYPNLVFRPCKQLWHFATLHVRSSCCWTQQGVFWATQTPGQTESRPAAVLLLLVLSHQHTHRPSPLYCNRTALLHQNPFSKFHMQEGLGILKSSATDLIYWEVWPSKSYLRIWGFHIRNSRRLSDVWQCITKFGGPGPI